MVCALRRRGWRGCWKRRRQAEVGRQLVELRGREDRGLGEPYGMAVAGWPAPILPRPTSPLAGSHDVGRVLLWCHGRHRDSSGSPDAAPASAGRRPPPSVNNRRPREVLADRIRGESRSPREVLAGRIRGESRRPREVLAGRIRGESRRSRW
jgi:hypothetical protein